MSEKRFIFATNEKWFLFDNETEEYMDMEDCKDKLNTQQATIQEYKKDNAKWRRKCLDLLVIIRTELLPRISDDEIKRLQKLIDDDRN